MKKNLKGTVNLQPLSREECVAVRGGDDIKKYLQCISTTLTTGGGGLRSFLLGPTLFGLARMLGVAVGCADL